MKGAETSSTGVLVVKVPVWMTLRDIGLTLFAWAIILYFLGEALHLGYEYLVYFKVVNAEHPDWREMWIDLHRFLIISGGLVLWLGFWAFYSRRRLRSVSLVPQPEPLSPKEHAESIGLTEEQLVRCKSYVITTIFFNSRRQITELRAQGKAAGSARGRS